MQKTLIVISKEIEGENGEKKLIVEPWTTLTGACKCHEEFSYHLIKKNKFPFNYKGWRFEKKDTNTCHKS